MTNSSKNIVKSWILPLKIETAANKWEHWTKSRLRKKNYLQCLFTIRPEVIQIQPPVVISLTRIAPRALDYDNLLHAFKSIRDDITKWIFPDKPRGQGDERCGIEFIYSQEKGEPKQYAIRIDVIQ
jgi:hypothetical protein